MTLYVLMNHCVVSLAVQTTVPGSSNGVPAVVLLCIHRYYGCACAALILLYKMLRSPIQTLVYAIALVVWMCFMFHGQFTYDAIWFDLLPPLFGVVLHTALKFNAVEILHVNSDQINEEENPSERQQETNANNNKSNTDRVSEPDKGANSNNKISKQDKCDTSAHNDSTALISNELCITGIGCIDSRLETFLHGSLLREVVNTFCKSGGSRHLNPMVQRSESITLDDVDVHWPQTEDLITPGMENGTLQSFTMVNNRAFSDTDAIELSKLLQNNASLQELKIVFDSCKSTTDKIFHTFFWDNCQPQFTHRGVKNIIDGLSATKESTLRVLDVYGVQLNEDTIKAAKDLRLKTGITVFGSKPAEATEASVLNSTLLKCLAALSVCGISTTLLLISIMWM